MLCFLFSFGKTENVQAQSGYKVIYANSENKKGQNS